MNTVDNRKVSFICDKDLYAGAERLAIIRDVSLSAIIREALVDKLKKVSRQQSGQRH